MEKERHTRIIAIVALVIAIIAISFGFAAFSNTLKIVSGSHVKPNATDFRIVASSSDVETGGTTLVPETTNGATAESALLVNGETTTIIGQHANFTEPGQKVTYTAYFHNTGNYVAYAKSITFRNVAGSNTNKVCTAIDPVNTSQALVDAACKDINIAVTLNIPGYTPSEKFTQSVKFNHDNDFSAGQYVWGETIIEYKDGGARADGPFIVQFGDIEFLFGSNNE